jgi:hypothetical protein
VQPPRCGARGGEQARLVGFTGRSDPLLASVAIPRSTLALLAAGLGLATERVALRLVIAGTLLAVLLRFGSADLVALALLVALAPAAPLSSPAGADRWRALSGLAAAALVALVPGSAALAAAVGLALLVCPPNGPALRLQAGWTGWLLAAVALAASYPWLRPEPLTSALALWGLRATPGGAFDGWLLAPVVGLGLTLALLRVTGRTTADTLRWLSPLLPAALLLSA